MREGLVFTSSFDLNKIQHRSFSQSFACISYMLAASRLSWSMELLAFASRQFAPKSWTSLSASFAFCSILSCERERSTLYLKVISNDTYLTFFFVKLTSLWKFGLTKIAKNFISEFSPPLRWQVYGKLYVLAILLATLAQ